ncbi:MAG: hypothetical protein HOW73_39325 [Polyangiaceae bacterium]|nr:hypothetical protein [Polyangiaceae bacterium]
MVTVLAVLAGCGEELLLCGKIPEGGCPVGRGGTCDDELCEALYDCVEGNWTLAETCESGSGGGGIGGGAPQGGSGAGGCEPVVFDHSDDAEGCTPDLQPPDCPGEAAEVCGDPCLTECIDFYLCKATGWTLVGFCNDAGELVVDPESTP